MMVDGYLVDETGASLVLHVDPSHYQAFQVQGQVSAKSDKEINYYRHIIQRQNLTYLKVDVTFLIKTFILSRSLPVLQYLGFPYHLFFLYVLPFATFCMFSTISGSTFTTISTSWMVVDSSEAEIQNTFWIEYDKPDCWKGRSEGSKQDLVVGGELRYKICK